MQRGNAVKALRNDATRQEREGRLASVLSVEDGASDPLLQPTDDAGAGVPACRALCFAALGDSGVVSLVGGNQLIKHCDASVRHLKRRYTNVQQAANGGARRAT